MVSYARAISCPHTHVNPPQSSISGKICQVSQLTSGLGHTYLCVCATHLQGAADKAGQLSKAIPGPRS